MVKYNAPTGASPNTPRASSSQTDAASSALSTRRTIYSHSPLSQADMTLLFTGIRKAGVNPGPEWTSLFSEALTDYVVHQNDPPDYIADAKANWLIGELRKSGGVSTKAEYAMLIEVMTRALGVPAFLSAFALKEIASAITNGKRWAFTDEDHPAGIVTKADVDALRAVLYAATTDSACYVTREEAEVLFEIANATVDGKADPAFEDLFARAIGNYLMAISLHAPSAAEELHREKWLGEREALPGFFSRILGGKSEMSFLGTLKSPLAAAEDDMAALNAQDERARTESEKITDSETDWIAEQLTRDGKLSSAETKLLGWLAAEAHALPPKLQALTEKAQAPVQKASTFGRRHSH